MQPADLAVTMCTRSAEGEALTPGPDASNARASRHEDTHPRQSHAC